MNFKVEEVKNFCFTVDDNIRCLKELTERDKESIFEHPYLAVYKRLHEKYGLKVQLNLFYETKDGLFNLSKVTDKFKKEWERNSEWLKLSFHSKKENERPYENSGYAEVNNDCKKVHDDILRFAGKNSLAKTTTLHCCRATSEGIKALKDNGVKGLLGVYGTLTTPKCQYQSSEEQSEIIRSGQILYDDGMAYVGIDIILNCFEKEEILSQLQILRERAMIKVMIHEQYFYTDYHLYQKDFEEKLDETFNFLKQNGYESAFLEDLIKQ